MRKDVKTLRPRISAEAISQFLERRSGTEETPEGAANRAADRVIASIADRRKAWQAEFDQTRKSARRTVN